MKRLAYIFTAVLALAACAREEIHHPTEAEAPKTASAYEPVIAVDQDINQVTFSVDAKAVIPVWTFQDKDGEFTERYARNTLSRIFTKAGDYKVRMQIMNAAGITPDYVEKTFHIDNTIVDFTKYVTILAGGSGDGATRTWHIDGTVDNHMGCGPSGSDGLEWWAASPGDKEPYGVYEDKVTFGSDYSYVYDPGDDGATYVNIDGVTVSPFIEQKGDATADYNALVDAQISLFSFDVDGDDLYLVLPAHTLFPYIDNDDFWANPRFKVLEVKPASLQLVHDNGSIAWHFILTSKEGPVKFTGFKYNAESNLWLPADAEGAHEIFQYTATGGSWDQLPNPEVTEANGTYSFTFETETTSQWQAQFHLTPTTPIVLDGEKTYDFSVVLSASKAVKNATLKLTATDSDDLFLFANNTEIPAADELIYYLTDVQGIYAPNGVKMVFDFGGCEAGTEVTISHIVLKDHAVDDGTVLPEPDEPEEPTGYTYGENLLGGLTLKETWFSPADWSGGLDPQAVYESGKLTLTCPEGIGGGEWQGQVKLVANVPADPEKQYAFFATIESGAAGVCTVKVADANADAEHAFFYDNNVALAAFEQVAYKNEPIVPDQAYEAVMVIFDFGRIPAGTEITVSGIELREITGTSGGSSHGENMLGGLTLKETWFSPGDWSGGLDPQASFEGGKLTLTCPEGIGGGEWQGQVKLVANVPADPEKTYYFSCKIESSSDGVCTVKVADANADAEHAFFYDNNVALAAYENVSYAKDQIVPDQAYEAVMVIFDFGRLPAGTEIAVTEITLCEVISGGESGGYLDNILGDLTLKETWFSPASWAGGLDPQASFEGGKLTLTCPEGIGGAEWQGQVKLLANVPADPAVSYQFSCNIESSSDGVCTVKVADANSDAEHAFFYDNNVALAAYEVVPYVNAPVSPDQAYEAVMVIFDFGRLPAGTEITVTDIELRPAK